MLSTATSARASVLSGHVTDIFGRALHPVAIQVHDSNSGLPFTSPGDTTDANGNFTLALPDGRYDLAFTPGLAARAFPAVRNSFRVTGPTPLQVQLAPGHLLTGRILTPLGAAVPHVGLRFVDAFGNAPVNLFNAVTDELGFVSALVSPGTWVVAGEPRLDQRIAPRRFGPVVLAADFDLGLVTMQPGFVLTGHLSGPAAVPLAGAHFEVRESATGVRLYTTFDVTDSAGVARFVLPPGTYDITGAPPQGVPRATRTARAVEISADLVLANLDLPSGLTVFAHCITALGVPVPEVACEVDSLPGVRRLQTPNGVSDASGDVALLVPTHDYRLAFIPPVSTRLLPVLLEPLHVAGPMLLGDIVHPAGHWLSVLVREAGTEAPLAGADLDLVDITSGRVALTIEDITNAAGFARVTTDQSAYHLVVRGPTADWNPTHVLGFRTLADTTMVVHLARPGLSVPDAGPGATGLALAAPWPNPARDLARTRIQASSSRAVELSVWDVSGRRVSTLYRGLLSAPATLDWRLSDDRGVRLGAGVYWLRLGDGRVVTTRRIAVLAGESGTRAQ